MAKRPQTPKEEFANALSHGVGLGCALVGIPFLILKSLESPVSYSWFGAACFSLGALMVYTFSTLYHASRVLRWKNKLQILDHISIYFLIAGSYTPMILAVLPVQKALIFLGILWGSVLIGTFFKIFYTGRFKALSLVLYLTMGWIAVFFLREISVKVGVETLAWIGIGGLAYTAGVYFYAKSNRLYYHFIWHLFVLAGTVAHFVAVYQLV
jgi:hemolysin III